MAIKAFVLGATALSCACVPFAPAVAADKPGSAYLQCDGQPNNMTDGETAARLIGAVTLLGLFAPPPESADASKRKFGAAGVAACDSLLSGERQEGNPARRVGLILARALHQVEAKNYPAALADVALGRREATAAGLMNDPYYLRSRGRAFDNVEGAILMRMGKPEEARAASLRGTASAEYSLLGVFATQTYDDHLRTLSAEEDRLNRWRGRLAPPLVSLRADRLELAGRFAEAARARDAYIEFDRVNTPELLASLPIARATVSHALAGNFDQAAARAQAARGNAEARRSGGKPEDDTAAYVEMMDLYAIIDTARTDPKAARRLFAARSEWVEPSLGSVLEVSRRLREGAAADELIGGLASDGDALWRKRADASRAELLGKDSDNKSLFALVPAAASRRDYEAISKNVWRTDKSRLVLKTKADPAKSRMELLFLPMAAPGIAMEAYVLHAALIARSRGHGGFVFSPLVTDNLFAASFRTGNRGEEGLPDELFIDAADTITKLSAVFPTPEELQRRNRQR